MSSFVLQSSDLWLSRGRWLGAGHCPTARAGRGGRQKGGRQRPLAQCPIWWAQMERAGAGISNSFLPTHPFPGPSWLFEKKAINPLVQRQMNLIPWGIPSFRTGLNYFSNLPPLKPSVFGVCLLYNSRVQQNAWQYSRLGAFKWNSITLLCMCAGI